jgi:lysophospholipase L1-like esterase
VASEVAAFQGAGKSVTLVDMYTDFPADGLSADHVHPNDEGYAFMAQRWFDAIAALTL